MTEEKFPKRIVLGEGWPYIACLDGVSLWGRPHSEKVLDGYGIERWAGERVALTGDFDLRGADCPKYRLVLERCGE